MSTEEHSTAPAIVEIAGEAVIVYEPTGIITSWNDAAVALYGYAAVDRIGRNIIDLVPPPHVADHAAIIERACTGEVVTGVPVVRRRKDGTTVAVSADFGRVSVVTPAVPAADDAARQAARLPSVEHIGDLIGHMDELIAEMDAEGFIIYAAGGALAAVGVRPEDVIGLNMRDFVGADDDIAQRTIDRVLSGDPHEGFMSMGDVMWRVRCVPRHDDTGRLRSIVSVMAPAEESRSQANTIARSEARYRALVQHASDLVCVVDGDWRISYISPSAHKLLGWHPSEVVGRPVNDFVQADDLAAVGATLSQLAPEYITEVSRQTLDVRLRHANGGWRHYEVVTSDYLADPAVGGFVVNGRDVTERRQADLRLRHANLHDALTDLPNRVLLIEQVDAALTQARQRSREDEVAVVAIGLDRFKLVNDSLGHDIGDRLLVAVARRLRRHVRAADTVARMSGDTFVVTTRKVSGGDEARAMAARLLAVVSEPFDLDGRRIAITAGAGVAVADEGADATTLVRNADTAMYAAKRIGRNRVELYEPSLRDNAARLLSLEQSLSHATGNGELRVHFQPIMALDDHQVAGVEALVRWQHPELGLVPPYDFIPLAEETGSIVDIGMWVLEESCRTLVAWGGGAPTLRLSVNLSPRQLLEADLPDIVADVLRRTGFPVHMLTMEVTESVLVDEGPYAATTLQRLREMGIKLSIDDFGTGYSSLVYLRRLNANALKIDRSFVDGLGHDSEADAIVRTVIGLARSLGLDLVAEGVETDEQRRQLEELGCQYAQGYLFSRPLPAAEFVAWMAAGEDVAVAG